MAYSKTKPYNRTNYKGATDPSYDRYLKEAEAAGRAENVKESELEKPYNVKQTYGAMQQDYNPVTPPTIDPGAGTGGLKCIWTSIGCEQLVGCWAGSDIVLEGPEAVTAGYQPVEVLTGEIITQTISGSESRAIEIVMSPIPLRNNFIVKFKDALGVVHTQTLDITCSRDLNWLPIDTSAISTRGSLSDCLTDSNGDIHLSLVNATAKLDYLFFTSLTQTWATENVDTTYTVDAYVPICLDSSGYPHIAFAYDDYVNEIFYLKHTYKDGGGWHTEDVASFAYTDYHQAYPAYIAENAAGDIYIIYSQRPSAYYYSGPNYVYCARKNSGSWAVETVFTPAAGDQSVKISAVKDTTDAFHVGILVYCFLSGTYAAKLKYTSGSWGSWAAPTTVYTKDSGNYDVKIVVDAANSPVISSVADYNAVGYAFHFISTLSGSWTTSSPCTTDGNIRLSTLCYAGTDLYVGLFVTNTIGDYAYFETYLNDGSWSKVTNLAIADISIHNIYSPKFVHDAVNNILHLIVPDDFTTATLSHYYALL